MILTQQNFSSEALCRFFETHFPEREWFYLDLYSDEELVRPSGSNAMGFYLTKMNNQDYPLEISLTETDEAIIARYQVRLAKALSEKFRMKTVIDFQHPEKPDNPYYSLLFDAGNCFLVDDSEWEDTGEFIVVGPWRL